MVGFETQSATERVARGATYLDAKMPGWFNRIDLRSFNIGNCAQCVLGHLFRGNAAFPASAFGTGLSVLGWEGTAQYYHGVALFEGLEDANRVQEAWVAEISNRRLLDMIPPPVALEEATAELAYA